MSDHGLDIRRSKPSGNILHDRRRTLFGPKIVHCPPEGFGGQAIEPGNRSPAVSVGTVTRGTRQGQGRATPGGRVGAGRMRDEQQPHQPQDWGVSQFAFLSRRSILLPGNPPALRASPFENV